MKINAKTKEKIISMIKNKNNLNEIAKKFCVSVYSISSIKYNDVLKYDERIECKICGLSFKQITNKHLNNYHKIDLKKYKNMFPNTPTATEHRMNKYKTFKNPNRGKTYDEIYGEEESKIKRNKISQKQIGRKCPALAGTGIAGTRRDTQTFARSTYEANVDRIFIYENKKYADEFTPPNQRFELKEKNNIITYQPDRVDLEGLFQKNSFIEIKGYMYPDDWKKINMFREQYKDKKLIVISPDLEFANISYSKLEKKYKPLISLWEDESNNYKTRPDLYRIDYQPDELTKYLNNNFKNQVHNSIVEQHKIFIAEKCINYNKISKGKRVYIVSADLIAIANKKAGAHRTSSGIYNYELWETKTMDGNVFYVTNTTKTVTFYCYEKEYFVKLNKFFENNCNKSLRYGRKQEWKPILIDKNVWQNANDREKEILKMCNNKIKHFGRKEIIFKISLANSEKTKKGANFNFEEWNIVAINSNNEEKKYVLSNFGHSTSEYVLNSV